MVLDSNWTGEYTRPGPRLYPHQWSWDSAFIAFGYARYDQKRAIQELRHLFDNQWTNGLLPQIVFDPHFGEYFPGIDFWHAECSESAVCVYKTSGVVQPPIHATATLHVYRHGVDRPGARAFLEEAFPRLVAWHDYLYRERDPENEGLVYIRHPWESGMDNSPLWDAIMLRMQLRSHEIPAYRRVDTHVVSPADRPESAAYDRFAYLVQLFSRLNYDEARIREDCPFLVQDVLFNSLLCQGERDLAQIAQLIGEDPSPNEERAGKTAGAVNRKLWDEEHGTYLDFDLATGQPIRVYAAAGFLPLFAGIPEEQCARRMVERLKTTGFDLGGEGMIAVPSYDPLGFGFSPSRYWRGPVWINIDWLLMRGLERYGYEKHARGLRESIVNLVRDNGFYEYFNPRTGVGHGSDLFSWSAALLLDAMSDSWW
ncbi:glycoside hydrolase [Rubrobacter tropicus]|uniref:Glycoside hydrolase n=2 Tax=Rubrobacter tropicus TaxID=2653851 RepID=A0A6G8QGC9_9ACTN|nr:glycoside hydrolase [Rubrobacter tropicus]